MADYPTPPQAPKSIYPKPAGPTPVVARAMEALRRTMPEVYPFLERAKLDTSDWTSVPSIDQGGFGGWAIRGATTPPLGGQSTTVKINPLLVALGSDADVGQTLAHEATHAQQMGTLSPLEFLIRSAAEYEKQPIEEEARMVGRHVSEGLPNRMPRAFYGIQGLQNFFNVNNDR